MESQSTTAASAVFSKIASAASAASLQLSRVPPYLLLSIFFVGYVLIRQTLRYRADRQFAKAHGCQPSEHVAVLREPVLGLDFLFECLQSAKAGRYLHYTHNRFRRFGTTYVTKRWAFDTVHTTDPENLKAMLATDFNGFKLSRTRVNAMTPLFGKGIFTTDGAQWAHSRAILRPSFTRQNMTPLLTMMERHFKSLLARIPKDGSEFDVQRLFYSFTMDTATEFLMGHSTYTLDPTRSSEPEARFVEDYLICCFEAVRKIQMGPLSFLSINWAARSARARAWAYVDKYVDDVLNGDAAEKKKYDAEFDLDGGAEYNFLREMARATDDRTLLRDQILNVLLASRDTTAGLLSNLFFELARAPQVYARLRAEVASLEGRIPTDTELKNLEYLRWCINETLRLYPSVPGNTREAARDTVLPVGGGPDGQSPLFIKKGTCIFYNVYSMHRRPDIYGADSESFRPERWDGLRPGWGYLPFNGGPRICLGQQFALTEAMYVTVRMVQHFSAISSTDDRPWLEFYTLALCSKNGVLVSLTPAKD